MKNISIILLIFFVYSCSYQKNDNELKKIELNRMSFPDSSKLIGQNIMLDSILSPRAYYTIRDSLFLIINRDTSPFYCFLYSKRKLLVKFARRGRGPNELLSASFVSTMYNYSNSGEIYLYDGKTKRLFEYNIDSLIKNQNYTPKRISLPDNVFNFSKMNDTCYICYNSFFINNKTLSNNGERIYTYCPNTKNSLQLKYKYFTPNVTKGFVLISPDKKKIIVPYYYEDRIDIFNNELTLIKYLKGPDFITPQYRLRFDNHVSFIKGKRYLGYNCCAYTNNAIYLVYVGLNGIKRNVNFRKKPVEIFKFNWSGEPLHRYKLDRYIYTISISSDERKIYGTYLDSIGESKLTCFEIKK